MEADADDLLVPTDLPVHGEVVYAAGHLDLTVEAWDRAHADCMQAGDREERRWRVGVRRIAQSDTTRAFIAPTLKACG